MKRQDFIRQCSSLCLGSGLLSTFLQSCTSVYYAKHVISANKVVVRKSEFLLQNGENEAIRPFVLVKSETFEFPICLYRLGDETFTALYMQCTHQGCEVHAHAEYLVCPCHGSEFSNHGKVINPPAELDLRQFATSHDAENIFIQLA